MLGIREVLSARRDVTLVTLDLNRPGSMASGKDKDMGGVRGAIGHLYVTDPEGSMGRLDLRVVRGVNVIIDRPAGDTRGVPLLFRAAEFGPKLIAMALDDSQLMWSPERGLEEFPALEAA